MQGHLRTRGGPGFRARGSRVQYTGVQGSGHGGPGFRARVKLIGCSTQDGGDDGGWVLTGRVKNTKAEPGHAMLCSFPIFSLHSIFVIIQASQRCHNTSGPDQRNPTNIHHPPPNRHQTLTLTLRESPPVPPPIQTLMMALLTPPPAKPS